MGTKDSIIVNRSRTRSGNELTDQVKDIGNV